MSKTVRQYIIWIVIGVVLLFGVSQIIYMLDRPDPSVDYTSIVECLKDEEVKFYGAFWCPHCKKQKEMFGASADSLPYIECSTQDRKGQTKVCIDNNISSYPTWVFKDGTRITGEQEPEKLAEMANCPVTKSDS